MRTVVIDAKALTYAVYVGRKLEAKYKAEWLLTANEVEALRTNAMPNLPEAA